MGKQGDSLPINRLLSGFYPARITIPRRFDEAILSPDKLVNWSGQFINNP